MFILVFMGITILLAIIDITITGGILVPIFYLVTLVPYISITTRRLHDTGRTGWWQLLYFLPGVGLFILIFLLVMDTNDYQNPYG